MKQEEPFPKFVYKVFKTIMFLFYYINLTRGAIYLFVALLFSKNEIRPTHTKFLIKLTAFFVSILRLFNKTFLFRYDRPKCSQGQKKLQLE